MAALTYTVSTAFSEVWRSKCLRRSKTNLTVHSPHSCILRKLLKYVHIFI